ncbi:MULTISPECIES: hypothetical protein [unclassified Marinobacter]|uniref:hypothetical protein n=1 Tax=unclassified Marinobacter TaxID=83889 RepID=UPI000BF59CA8|nr:MULTISPECIES: hypothetical protein [unclassified Marinobacter]PFG10712.1 hypothetical protein ATI45_3184 [Marinobacter sp. LV10MA510-1]PFG52599.1 hypothetical protein ATG98_1641 [Marinobacter sp. LV10R520-4]PFG52601.1 hypothetical protein ATG98_1643 [Marinobacter sp. LV10R520-4]
MKSDKADAALYLLTGLLQRLDAERPGMIQEMIAGVEGDRAALPENIENREYVEKIFDEAVELLTRANTA